MSGGVCEGDGDRQVSGGDGESLEIDGHLEIRIGLARGAELVEVGAASGDAGQAESGRVCEEDFGKGLRDDGFEAVFGE